MKHKILGAIWSIILLSNSITLQQPVYAEDTDEVATQQEHKPNGRQILFPDKEAKFRIVGGDDDVDEQLFSGEVSESVKRLCRDICDNLQKVCLEESQDGKILNMLEVTNYMDKQLGLKFSKDVVDLFNTNVKWSIEYKTTKVNDDDDTVDLLLILKSDSDVFKPKAVNFNIDDNKIKGVITY